MQLAELPGRGLGRADRRASLPAALARDHVRRRRRARHEPREQDTVAGEPPTLVRPAKEAIPSLAPQLSFNFGTGHGWSYLSGGIGQSTGRSSRKDGADYPPDRREPLKTINYGGGARWFIKPHLAFSFDVRFYAINPGTAVSTFPGSPRTTLLVIGAGVSIK